MPEIAALRVPCQVKGQALSLPVRIGVEGERPITLLMKPVADLGSRVAVLSQKGAHS